METRLVKKRSEQTALSCWRFPLAKARGGHMRVLVISAALLLASCGINSTPEGPPNFRAGWDAGCQSGYAAAGMVLFFRFTRDIEAYDTDSIYRQGWDAGYQHCHSQQSVLNNLPAPEPEERRTDDPVVAPAPD